MSVPDDSADFEETWPPRHPNGDNNGDDNGDDDDSTPVRHEELPDDNGGVDKFTPPPDD